MSYTTINKSTDYFNTVTYSGSETPQTITGVNFSADMAWFKNRTGTAAGGNIYDTVRGISDGWLYTNETAASNNSGQPQITLNSDGYVLNSGYDLINDGSSTYVSWNWKANGSGSANTDGSINSTVSVNTTSGFSIVKYTGTGANATVGHGLGVVPKWIIVKKFDSSEDWEVYHASLGATKEMRLNTTDSAGTSSTRWNDTEPTSSLFYLGNDSSVNASGGTYVAYCFAEKTGYSKFGQYTGNGSSNGSFIFTGFKPSLVITKCFAGTNAGSTNWSMMDNKRFGYNTVLPYVYANTSGVEQTTQNVNNIDILSNGFKCKESDANRNAAANSYIFMAFGQSLVGTNNIPNNAF